MTRLQKFGERRKTKEWNLIGQLFDAATAECYYLINWILPADLSGEVEALIAVVAAKNSVVIRR